VNLLLDTHIWLWSAQEPHKLNSEVHRVIADRRNARYLSPVSIWEVIVLLEKKRIAINQDFGQWFEQTKVEFDLQEAPFDWKVVHELRFTMLEHRDPADRLLAATAMAHDMVLVTSDQRLLRVPNLKTLANI
jgi:PIN domain nuclease of toxin-antitoxin system